MTHNHLEVKADWGKPNAIVEWRESASDVWVLSPYHVYEVGNAARAKQILACWLYHFE